MDLPFLQNFPKLQLDLAGSLFALLVAAAVAIAISAYVYRYTIPEVRPSLRRLLFSLRAAALLVIVVILFRPVVRLSIAHNQPATVAVLVDESASMGLTDGRGSRIEQVYRTLSDPLFEHLSDKFEVHYFRFSDRAAPWQPKRDSLRFEGDGTDIQGALAQIRETLRDRHLSAVLVLTDGADNLGENPARFASTLGVPIYAVGIGDPSEARDLLISGYSTNEIVYAGNRVPVDVTIKSFGFEGRRISVTLKKGDKTIDQARLTLAGGMLEQVVRLHFTPDREGFQKYELVLPSLENELTTRNNRQSFYVKVLKGRMKVLLVAGGPSTDFAFLRRTLESDANVEVQTFVERQRGTFYEGSFPRRIETLKTFDLMILLDYPRRTSNPAVIQAIADLVVAESKPLLLLPGPGTAFSRLAPLRNVLPIRGTPAPASEQQVFARLTAKGTHHPLLRVAEEQIENKARWQALPPVFSIWTQVDPAPGSEVLAVAAPDRVRGSRATRPPPMILTRRTGGAKTLAVMAHGLWRWKFLMAGAGKPTETYERFFRNAVRWLATREDSKLVRVRPNKEVYHSGEQVEFTAQVYYEDYLPVDGAEVKVVVRADTTVDTITLLGTGEGRYEGRIQVLAGGDYSYEATATKDGAILGRDRGRFSVEPFTLEFQNTRMNEPLLREIAERSGGRYVQPEDLQALQTDLDLPPRQIIEEKELPLWSSAHLLAIVVLLLGTEWFVRKRLGML